MIARGGPCCGADQAVVASLVVIACAGMAAYWVVKGGPRGGLVEIDRVAPLERAFPGQRERGRMAGVGSCPTWEKRSRGGLLNRASQAGAFGDLNDFAAHARDWAADAGRDATLFVADACRENVAGVRDLAPGS